VQITAQKFADTANRAIEIREASYNGNSSYDKSRHEAVEEAMKELELDAVWFWPLALFIFDGYAESSEWIEENKSK
jgi:hypothetical protein